MFRIEFMAGTKQQVHRDQFRSRRGLVSPSGIRDLAQQIAERFRPNQIILFGSYAKGHPKPDSDVDILVVMKTANEIDQSVRIEEFLDPPFSVDIIVRTPKNMRWRLQEGDWFLREAVEQGQILYETANQGMGAQGRRRPGSRSKNSKGQTTPIR
jgi:predicted nucleotidyltransferase